MDEDDDEPQLVVPAGAAAAASPAAAAPPAPPQPQQPAQQQQQQAQRKKSFVSSMASWSGFGRKPAAASAPDAAAAAAPPMPPPPAKAKKLRFARNRADAPTATPSYRRQVDTNVVSVQLASLANDVAIHSGDVTVCECGAVLNALSTVAPAAEGKLWTCEFCGHANALDLDDEELPKAESVDYILTPAPAAVAAEQDAARIVFCVDTSGSMCVTTAVPGSFKLKHDKRAEVARELNRENFNQVRAADRGVTYVSRLQCMQGAIENQLVSTARQHPERSVGLVTFSSDVQLVGDCSRDTTVVAGDKLRSVDALRAAVREAGATALEPVRVAKDRLTRKIMELEEGGQTALGPAIVCAIEMACAGGAGGAGSQVIVCTDGLANTGIGSLEGLAAGGADADAAAEFYTALAAYAKERGVMVSIVTITGEECRLAELSALADHTGGDVERVNPLELRDNFQAMLENPVLASNVQATMLLHRNLHFRGDDQGGFKRVVDIGNVTAESEQFFEFAMADALALPPGTRLPFQLQLRFRRLNGMEVLRVLTQFKAVTADRAQAERDVNVAVLSANAAQQSAQLAAKGQYRDARVNSYAWRNLMGRTCTSELASAQQQTSFANYLSAMNEFDSTVHQAQATERADLGDLDDALADERERESARRARRTDSDSRMLHKTKHISSKHFM